MISDNSDTLKFLKNFLFSPKDYTVSVCQKRIKWLCNFDCLNNWFNKSHKTEVS